MVSKRFVFQPWVGVLGACALAGAIGCSSATRALIVFDVAIDGDVPDIDQLRFSAPKDARVPTIHQDATSARPGFRLGYYMPVSGTVEVLGEALHDGCTVGE